MCFYRKQTVHIINGSLLGLVLGSSGAAAGAAVNGVIFDNIASDSGLKRKKIAGLLLGNGTVSGQWHYESFRCLSRQLVE